MFNVIRNVISAGGYRLADMQYRIKKLYALGDLTEKQTDQLLAMASLGVSLDAERPEAAAMVAALAEKLEALAARVQILEGNQTDSGDTGAYPAWKAWDGISQDYRSGAVVTHNGKTWISVFQGQNVWEPGTVDETFWEELREG